MAVAREGIEREGTARGRKAGIDVPHVSGEESAYSQNLKAFPGARTSACSYSSSSPG